MTVISKIGETIITERGGMTEETVDIIIAKTDINETKYCFDCFVFNFK